jgi:hypothetical protein
MKVSKEEEDESEVWQSICKRCWKRRA